MTTRRQRFLTFLLPLASVIFVMLVGEAAVRLWHFWRWNISLLDGRPAGGPGEITLDSELGWRATENYRFNGTKLDAAGTEYAVQMHRVPKMPTKRNESLTSFLSLSRLTRSI